MDLSLDNRTALVTGSTRGIGHEIARALLLEGATVFINGRKEAAVQSAVEELEGAGDARPAPGDVSDPDAVDRMVERIRSHDPLDVLVNNVAVFEPKPFEEIDDEEWMDYFNTNVMSAVRLSRAFLSGMLERDWGRIIMVSSEAGVKPIPHFLHYSVTKTALLGLSRGLAEHTKGTDVTVNSLLPGPTKTDGVIDFFEDLAEQEGMDVEDLMGNFFEEEEPNSFLRRFAQPDEIAAVAAFLCSEEAVVINGTAQRADGGLIRSIL